MKSLAPSFESPMSLRENFDECQRTGAICAFNNYQEFLNDHETILEMYDNTQERIFSFLIKKAMLKIQNKPFKI